MPDAIASETAKLTLPGQELELPITVGSEGEHAIDITKLRGATGYITLDPGYRNTGSCTSQITFINPDKGVLRYRGYPIEQLADQCSFIETAYLLIHGELPTATQRERFNALVSEHSKVDQRLLKILNGFPQDANPMAMLSACISGLCGYHPEVITEDYAESFDVTAAKLMGKVKTLACAIYRHASGLPAVSSSPDIDYSLDFLRMMFGDEKPQRVSLAVAKALDTIFLLHADHEQNCSASTVRMVGSSHANLFAACVAGINALWGPLHGGANVAIMNQLQQLHTSGQSIDEFMAGVKDKKYRLFGFGHPVYRNYDPRARILKASADEVLDQLGAEDDPLLAIAKRLEAIALADDYFVSRNLYPNVDFYSGIIMRAMGIPTEMFTVLFAIGRMPGWVAQYKEVRDEKGKIYRPRQVYTGPADRAVKPIDQRG